MQKAEKIRLLKTAAARGEQCALYFHGELTPYYCIPLGTTDKFLLCAEEVDFVIDGFAVHKLSDLEEVEIMDDFYSEILRRESHVTEMAVPSLELDSWHSLFRCLMNEHEYVMIDTVADDNSPFAGKIVSINETLLGLKSFDRFGDWTDVVISFKDIIYASFGSRYLRTWQKYLS